VFYVLDFVSSLATYCQQLLHCIATVFSCALLLKVFWSFSENLNYTYFIICIYSYLFIYLFDWRS